MAASKNYHGLGSIKPSLYIYSLRSVCVCVCVYTLSSGGQKSKICMTELQLRFLARPHSLWRFWGRILSLPLSVPGGCQPPLACGHITPVSAFLVRFLLFQHSSISFCLLLIRTPSTAFRTTWIIWDNLFIVKSLTWSHLQRPFSQIR